MISEKEVQHIAKLARFGLTAEEVRKFQKELSSILDYIEKLKEVDVSGIKPTSHTTKIENVMRNDEIESQKPASYRAEGSGAGLMELAPETKDGYLKVKSIVQARRSRA